MGKSSRAGDPFDRDVVPTAHGPKTSPTARQPRPSGGATDGSFSARIHGQRRVGRRSRFRRRSDRGTPAIHGSHNGRLPSRPADYRGGMGSLHRRPHANSPDRAPVKLIIRGFELHRPSGPNRKPYSTRIQQRHRLQMAALDCYLSLTCSNDRHRPVWHYSHRGGQLAVRERPGLVFSRDALAAGVSRRRRGQPVRRDTKLTDLANGFANNGRGQLRMPLDQALVCDRWKQARQVRTDLDSRNLCYGSDAPGRG